MLIAVVSDIHGNLAAFKAVLAALPAVDELWCLGDIVGYGPNPNECIQLLDSRRPTVVVAGNHDWAAVGRLDVDTFNPEAAEAICWTARQLTPRSRLYLDSLPTRQVRDDWTVVHGSPRYPVWEYLLDCSDAGASFKYFDTRYCLVGHTHVPAIFVDGYATEESPRCTSEPVLFDTLLPLPERRTIFNPGSTGQPRDGDPKASYLLLDTERATVEYRRTPYDIRRTQEQMKRVGLPTRLWLRLSYGL